MKAWLTIVALLFATPPLEAQYYFYDDEYYDSPLILELGISAGAMNCLTDLGGRNKKGSSFLNDVNLLATRICANVSASLQYNGIIGLRFEFCSGKVSAADSLIRGDKLSSRGRFIRNLSFHSSIREWLLAIEWYPLSIPSIADNGPPAINPYIVAGAGRFTFRPEAVYRGAPQDLPSLHTEGQGFPDYPQRKRYPLRQWNLPVGIGLKYEASAIAVIRFEFMYRKLWTDYLDDVSSTYIDPELFYKYLHSGNADKAKHLSDQSLLAAAGMPMPANAIRGNDKNNDAYFTFSLKLALAIGRKKR